MSDESTHFQLSEPEADMQRRSQENKEKWRYVLSVFDPIKSLPDRKLTKKHLSGNLKPYNKKNGLKKSKFPKLEHVFQSSNNKCGKKVPKPFGKKLEALRSGQVVEFGDNMKTVAATSLNLINSECGKPPYLRVVSNPSNRRCSPSATKVFSIDNANEDYNIDWSSSDSENESMSSNVIINDNANDDYNIVWSSSESENEAWNNKSYQADNKSLVVKSKYAGRNTELDLLIQAIKKDCHRTITIREKYTQKGGYSEKFRSMVGKSKMDFRFLDYEQSAGILQGMFAVITKKEKSYGVYTANVKLENDNSCNFFLDRRAESAKDGHKLVSFVNGSRFYTVNGLNIFIQPNKVVCA